MPWGNLLGLVIFLGATLLLAYLGAHQTTTKYPERNINHLSGKYRPVRRKPTKAGYFPQFLKFFHAPFFDIKVKPMESSLLRER